MSYIEFLMIFQRGKFRPRLTELVQTNTDKEVIDASTEAFQKLPDVSAAIQALTVLKAIGPATASGAYYDKQLKASLYICTGHA